MKKYVAVILIVSALIFAAVSCMPAETVVIKGELTGVKFNAPNVPCALADHEYSKDEYHVMACYSSGYEEDVTASAKIEGEYVEVTSTGGLIFKSCYTDDHSCYKNEHKYTVNISYMDKTAAAVVYAYRIGDYLSFKAKSNPTKIFEGASLTPSIVETSYIAEITESGMFSSSTFPASGFVTIFNEDDEKSVSGTLDTIRPVQEGDTRISCSVCEDSEVRSMDIKVLPLTDAKGIRPFGLNSNDVKEGSEFDKDTFIFTYMKNYKVYLCDNEDYKVAEVRSLMYATDENGNVNSGYKITITVSRNGAVETKGTFEKGDIVKIEVEYQISEDKTLTATRDITV